MAVARGRPCRGRNRHAVPKARRREERRELSRVRVPAARRQPRGGPVRRVETVVVGGRGGRRGLSPRQPTVELALSVRVRTSAAPCPHAAGVTPRSRTTTGGAARGRPCSCVFRESLEETGRSYAKEVEMIALARRMDLLTTPYVFDDQDAFAMPREAAAGIGMPQPPAASGS
ncbi:MAG: phosphoenolpyruvate hydrolase family protein [Acidobacteria bacterium]|nr:phosphoenolpyruvate hydrolase family protein [Acidobacteriota bacterium]